MATAWAASAGFLTVPVNISPLPCGCTLMRLFGRSRSIADWVSRAENEDGCTVSSYCTSRRPSASITAMVVRPAFRPKMNNEVALAGRTSATFGSATKMLETGVVSDSTFPVPASTVMAVIGLSPRAALAGVWPNSRARTTMASRAFDRRGLNT